MSDRILQGDKGLIQGVPRTSDKTVWHQINMKRFTKHGDDLMEWHMHLLKLIFGEEINATSRPTWGWGSQMIW